MLARSCCMFGEWKGITPLWPIIAVITAHFARAGRADASPKLADARRVCVQKNLCKLLDIGVVELRSGNRGDRKEVSMLMYKRTIKGNESTLLRAVGP